MSADKQDEILNVKLTCVAPAETIAKILTRILENDYSHDDIAHFREARDAYDLYLFVKGFSFEAEQPVGAGTINESAYLPLLDNSEALMEDLMQDPYSHKHLRSVIQVFSDGATIVRHVPEPKCDLPRGSLNDFLEPLDDIGE